MKIFCYSQVDMELDGRIRLMLQQILYLPLDGFLWSVTQQDSNEDQKPHNLGYLGTYLNHNPYNTFDL